MDDNLWIETGDMSGGSRNQIEFDEDLASFFSTDLPGRGAVEKLALSVSGGNWTDCELAHKVTTYGVDIYRLSMVTAAKGGEDYPGRVIRFSRAGGRYFNVTVVDVDSPEHREWVARSAAEGTLDRTGGAGGRQFGTF